MNLVFLVIGKWIWCYVRIILACYLTDANHFSVLIQNEVEGKLMQWLLSSKRGNVCLHLLSLGLGHAGWWWWSSEWDWGEDLSPSFPDACTCSPPPHCSLSACPFCLIDMFKSQPVTLREGKADYHYARVTLTELSLVVCMYHLCVLHCLLAHLGVCVCMNSCKAKK